MSDASELQDAESSSSSVSEVAAHAAACTTRRTELERRFDALMHRRALVEANTRRGRETEGHVSRARAQTIERRIDSLRKEQAQRHHRLAAPTLLPQRPAPPRVHSDTATQLEQARAEYEAFVYGQGSTWIEHERQRVDAENRRLAALKRIEVESQTLPSQVRISSAGSSLEGGRQRAPLVERNLGGACVSGNAHSSEIHMQQAASIHIEQLGGTCAVYLAAPQASVAAAAPGPHMEPSS